jgi:hypothetical protein
MFGDKLTKEQKIKRAVSRINNKTRKAYPLFAGEFDTTIEDQIERYNTIEKDHDEYVKRLNMQEEDFRLKGCMFRKQASLLYTQEEFTRLDEYYNRVFGYMSAAYMADFWRKKVEHCRVSKRKEGGDND